jgi:hypothetical protein
MTKYVKGSVPPGMWLRPLDLTPSDPTCDGAVRRVNGAPDYSYMPSLDAWPEFQAAMALPPGELRARCSAALRDAYLAWKRGRGTLYATELLFPVAIAYFLRTPLADARVSDQHIRRPCTRTRAADPSDVILPLKDARTPMMTVAEAARLRGVDPSTVRRWAPSVPGAFTDPATGAWWLPVADVLEWSRAS